MNKITVVGCGVMGSALINAFMNGGAEVTIVDLVKENAEKFVARGAKYAPTLDEAPLSQVILLNLPTHAIASKVLQGAKASGLAGKMLINTTTSTPEEVKDMDRIAGELGMAHLDAKLEVYPGEIGPETGYIVYSGSKEVFEKNESMLESIGKAVYLGDDVVAASVTDLTVLNVHFAAMAALAEAGAYCIKNGVSTKTIMGQIQTILPIMLQGNFRAYGEELEDYDGEFEDASECTLNIESTAMDTTVRAIRAAGVKTPCGDVVAKMFRQGVENGYAKKNVCAIVKDLI